jgi:hypothetical protein
MASRSMRSACDRGSSATFAKVGHWMRDQKYIISTPCFGKHVKPLIPFAFAVVSTHQSALGPRGGLWPVLLI